MPVVAIFLQLKEGTNLIVRTRLNVTRKLTYRVIKDFTEEIQRIQEKALGTQAKGSSQQNSPNLSKGKLIVENKFQVNYSLLHHVYLGVIQDINENPFSGDYHLEIAKSHIMNILKSDKMPLDDLMRKYSSIAHLLENVLYSTQLDPLAGSLNDIVRLSDMRNQNKLDTLMNSVDFALPMDVVSKRPTPISYVAPLSIGKTINLNRRAYSEFLHPREGVESQTTSFEGESIEVEFDEPLHQHQLQKFLLPLEDSNEFDGREYSKEWNNSNDYVREKYQDYQIKDSIQGDNINFGGSSCMVLSSSVPQISITHKEINTKSASVPSNQPANHRKTIGNQLSLSTS